MLFYNHSLSSDPSFRLLSQVYYSWCEAISKLVHLQKLVFIFSVTDTVWYDDTRSQLDAEISKLNFLSHITIPMPNLTELTIGKLHNASRKFYYDNIFGACEQSGHRLSYVAPNLNKLSLGLDGNRSALEIMSTQLYNLHHLQLSDIRQTYHEQTNNSVDVKELLPRLHNLKSLDLQRSAIAKDLLIPEWIEALRLQIKPSCSVIKNMSNLVVLELENPYGSFRFWDDSWLDLRLNIRGNNPDDIRLTVSEFCAALRSLSNLKILIMSRTKQAIYSIQLLDVFYQCIEDSLPCLFSLIGVDYRDCRSAPSKIEFLSRYCWQTGSQILMKKHSANDAVCWKEERKYSSEWSRAYGTAYFHSTPVTKSLETAEELTQTRCRPGGFASCDFES